MGHRKENLATERHDKYAPTLCSRMQYLGCNAAVNWFRTGADTNRSCRYAIASLSNASLPATTLMITPKPCQRVPELCERVFLRTFRTHVCLWKCEPVECCCSVSMKARLVARHAQDAHSNRHGKLDIV